MLAQIAKTIRILVQCQTTLSPQNGLKVWNVLSVKVRRFWACFLVHANDSQFEFCKCVPWMRSIIGSWLKWMQNEMDPKSSFWSPFMTPCEVVWWYHSRSVTKNLTPYRFNSAGWGPYGQNAEIHSFPTMYIMVGVNEVEMGQNNDFLPKNGLKIAFLSITILDHPTSDWAGTQNFKGIAKFNMCFKNNGI